MLRIILAIICAVLSTQFIYSQSSIHTYRPYRFKEVRKEALKENYYWVEFTDKNQSKYSIERPEEFLSPRAIERRQKYHIPIDKTDLPINEAYLNEIMLMGVKITHKLKWFNAIVIYTEDYLQLSAIKKLPFVKSTEIKRDGIRPAAPYRLLPELEKFQTSNQDIWNLNSVKIQKTSYQSNYYDYGWSNNQIEMLNGINLHNWGYKGNGIHVGVIDAGFYKVPHYKSFDSLRINHQILGMRDFVDNDSIVTDDSYHGMKVLSTMGANSASVMVGTSPKASFWLLRSENAHNEHIIEEAYWVAAAEFADSVGVDLLNTSLGYNDFDVENQNYTTDKLNGYHSLMSVAQNMAARKGMLPVNSAGNTGWETWKYLTIPADADSTFTVGAVDMRGAFGTFSAKGPTTDGRIKPNVVSRGVSSVVQEASGGISFANGTSFSSPIIAGMTASLWQAHPELNNMQLMRCIETASHQYYLPDTMLGYGVPNYTKALLFAQGIQNQSDYLCSFRNFGDAARSLVALKADAHFLEQKVKENYRIEIKDITRNIVLANTEIKTFYSYKGIEIEGFASLPKGVYSIKIGFMNDVFEGYIFK